MLLYNTLMYVIQQLNRPPRRYGGEHARIQRALTQRIYVLNINETDTSFEHEINGVTDDYTVSIQKQPQRTNDTCTCPDFVNHQHACKHIYLTLYRIYGFTRDELLVLDDCDKLPSDPKQYALKVNPYAENEEVELKHVCVEKAELIEKTKERNCTECAICYEEFKDRDITTNFICALCNNQLHSLCFLAWLKRSKTCPYCRYALNK